MPRAAETAGADQPDREADMDIVQLNMFDGKVCGRCREQKPVSEFGKNKSRKDGLQSYCTQCRHLYDGEKNKTYYHQDIEKSRQKTRQWYQDNKGKLAEPNRKRAKEWYQDNKDRARAAGARNYRENIEARRITSRAWYLQNKDHVKTYRARYKKVKSAYINSINQARRARQRAMDGTYTADQWHQLCAWFENVCLACGMPEKLTVDHVVPLDPGSNTVDNLQPLCLSCNSSKGRKTIDYRDPERLAAFLEHIQCLGHTEISQPSKPDTL